LSTIVSENFSISGRRTIVVELHQQVVDAGCLLINFDITTTPAWDKIGRLRGVRDDLVGTEDVPSGVRRCHYP